MIAVSTLSAFFSWPNGGVWANLLASLIWGVPAFVTHHRLMRRHHVNETAKQTAELKAHIDSTLGGPLP